MNCTVVIPFSGFYDSVHDDALDRALDGCFADASGSPNDTLSSRAANATMWPAVHALYARDYAGYFCTEFKIRGWQFQELHSPREYNFTTDRIFGTLPIRELRRLMRETPWTTLDATAASLFTSRSGFSSFYSPDVGAWGPLTTWDHNQFFALITAYVQHTRGDFDAWAELDIMEHASCNGHLESWIFANASDELQRIDRIGGYLRKREERVYLIGA